MPRYSLASDDDLLDALLDRFADKLVLRLKSTLQPAESQPPKRAFRMKEVGEIISVSEREVYQLIKDGELGAIRVGRIVLVPSSAIDDFISQKLDTTNGHNDDSHTRPDLSR